MEMIAFLDVFKVCQNFVNNPSKENTDKLDELKKQLIIKAYLPMQDKVVTLYRIAMDADKSTDLAAAVFSGGLEMAFIFTGLPSYTNIDVLTIPKEMKIYESYDALIQSGLVDYILQYCERDYNRLVKMMERTMSYEHLLELTDTMSRIQPEPIRESLEEFKKFRESATPEMLHDMADIVRFNDPNLYKVKESVVDGALAQLERMDKAEKIAGAVVDKTSTTE